MKRIKQIIKVDNFSLYFIDFINLNIHYIKIVQLKKYKTILIKKLYII